MDEKTVFCKIKSGEGQEWGRAGVGKGEWGRASGEGRVGQGQGQWERKSGSISETVCIKFVFPIAILHLPFPTPALPHYSRRVILLTPAINCPSECYHASTCSVCWSVFLSLPLAILTKKSVLTFAL